MAEGVESISGGGRRASTEPIEAKGREKVHTYHIPITPTHSPYFMQKYYELHRVEIGVYKAPLCRNPVQQGRRYRGGRGAEPPQNNRLDATIPRDLALTYSYVTSFLGGWRL